MASSDPPRDLRLGSGVRGLLSGIAAVFTGLGRLMRDAPLRKLALIPLAITIVAYVLVLVAAVFLTDDLLASVWAKPKDWLVYVWYVIIPIIYVALLAILALLFVSIAGVISGPFYEEMVKHVLAGKRIDVKPVGMVKGAFFEITRTLLFLVPAVLCGLLGLIPAVGLPFVVAGTAIGWLGLASTAVNPALIATGHGLGDQLSFPFRSLGVMLGAGAVVWISLLVPVLGLLSVPAAVIGLTELYARAVAGPEVKTTPSP